MGNCQGQNWKRNWFSCGLRFPSCLAKKSICFILHLKLFVNNFGFEDLSRWCLLLIPINQSKRCLILDSAGTWYIITNWLGGLLWTWTTKGRLDVTLSNIAEKRTICKPTHVLCATNALHSSTLFEICCLSVKYMNLLESNVQSVCDSQRVNSLIPVIQSHALRKLKTF